MRFLKTLVNFTLGIVVAFGLLLLLPKAFGIEPNIVLSGSMEPYMSTGGLAFTNTKDVQPEIGDVITYRIDNSQVTHRVIDQKNGVYVTKGDANEGEDATPVTKEQIVGTVVLSIPYLGYVASYLHKKYALFFIAALFVLHVLMDMICDDKSETEENILTQKEF
mgnify:CR=1 FL=1